MYKIVKMNAIDVNASMQHVTSIVFCNIKMISEQEWYLLVDKPFKNSKWSKPTNFVIQKEKYF